MNRYRIRYKKTGPIRYISHLDLLRTLERSARRAGLPLAFTGGYNPHPKISFAAPLPVGVEGYDEYLDLELEKAVEPSEVKNALNTGMPAGLVVLSVKEIDRGDPALMGLVEKATYKAEAVPDYNLDNEKLAAGLETFMQQGEIMTQKKTKKGTRDKNIRPGIMELTGDIKDGRLCIRMTLQTGSKGNIRPQEVLSSLAKGYLPLHVEEFGVARTGLLAAGDRNLFEA